MRKKNFKINLVIIGAGNMANEYLKVARTFKEINIFGIYSRTYKKALKLKNKYKINKIYKSLSEIKKCKICDILIVCVSAENNEKIYKFFLKSKLNILAEKPISLDFKSSKQIIDKSKKLKSKIFVALNRRYFDSNIYLKKIIKKMKGKRILEVFDCQNKNRYEKLGHNKKVINSLMYANSIHLIDYFNMLCRGKVKRIVKMKFSRKIPIVIAKIMYSSGDIGIYYANWNRHLKWKIKLTVNEKIEFVLQPLETIKAYKISNNKLILSKSFPSKYKDGLKNMLQDLIYNFYNKNNDLISLNKHFTTIKLIKDIYGK